MKLVQKSGIYFLIFITLFAFMGCKTQNSTIKAPFTITEKTYFYWVGGKEGTNGTTIKIAGTFKTTNLEFSKIYFQNHEYKVIPEFKQSEFIVIGNRSDQLKENIIMHRDPSQEFGNKPPNSDKKIPFDLEQNEAILVYAINGKDYYYKVESIKELATVTFP
jgi:hypothetical protein